MLLCHLGESWRFSFYRLAKIFLDVVQSLSHVWLCDPMDCSMPGFPLLIPLVSPRVCSNSFPLSWWNHPIILSSLTPFSSCHQSFPTSGSSAVSWLIASCGQSIGGAASASGLPMNAAKSLLSCPTLCDPIDGSPPGSPVPGILQARILEWDAISFSNAWKWKVKVKSLSLVWLLETPWTAAYQAPLSWDFPGKNTGVGCHCLLRPDAWGCNNLWHLEPK